MTPIEAIPLLRSARLLGYVLLAIFGTILGAAALLIVWLITDLPQTGASLLANIGYADAELRDWQAYALGAIALMQLSIWAGVVWQGRQIFTALTMDDVGRASDAAGKTARLLWVMLIWGIAAGTLGALVATWHFPEGQRALVIGLGSAQLSTIFAALLASFISHAFVLGAALWQDHREVI